MVGPENDILKRKPANWAGPWIELAILLNLLARDAAGAISIVALAHLVEVVIDKISGQPWKWSAGNAEIAPVDILHYGDLVILTGFVLTSLFEFWKWMRQQ